MIVRVIELLLLVISFFTLNIDSGKITASKHSYTLNTKLLQIVLNSSNNDNYISQKRILFVPDSCLVEPTYELGDNRQLLLSTKTNSVHFGSLMLDVRRNAPIPTKNFVLMGKNKNTKNYDCAYVASWVYDTKVTELGHPAKSLMKSVAAKPSGTDYEIALSNENCNLKTEYDELKLVYTSQNPNCSIRPILQLDEFHSECRKDNVTYRVVHECNLAIPIGARTLKEYTNEYAKCIIETSKGVNSQYVNPLKQGYLSFSHFGCYDKMKYFCSNELNWSYCSMRVAQSPRECAAYCLLKPFCQYWTYSWDDKACIMQTYLYIVSTVHNDMMAELKDVPKLNFCGNASDGDDRDLCDPKSSFRLSNKDSKSCVYLGVVYDREIAATKGQQNALISGSKILNEPVVLENIVKDRSFTEATIEVFEALFSQRGEQTTTTSTIPIFITTEFNTSKPSSSLGSTTENNSHNSSKSSNAKKLMIYGISSVAVVACASIGSAVYIFKRRARLQAAAENNLYDYEVYDYSDDSCLYYDTEVAR